MQDKTYFTPKELSQSQLYMNTVMDDLPMLEEGKTYTKQELVMSHLRLVVRIVSQYVNKNRHDQENLFDDLIQEGNLALMKAAETFDPSQNIAFASYAIPHIKYAIQEARMEAKSTFKLCTTKAHRKVYFNISKYRSGETLNPDELIKMSTELNLSVDKIRESELRLRTQYFSIDDEYTEDGDAYAYTVGDETYEPSKYIENLEMEYLLNYGIKNAMNKLNDREKVIIQERWMNDENAPVLKEFGERFGVSTERARQIEQGAMKKLRKELEPAYI